MSTPFAILLLAVVFAVVGLTLHFTSKTPTIAEIVISAEPSPRAPVSSQQETASLTAAKVPDASRGLSR